MKKNLFGFIIFSTVSSLSAMQAPQGPQGLDFLEPDHPAVIAAGVEEVTITCPPAPKSKVPPVKTGNAGKAAQSSAKRNLFGPKTASEILQRRFNEDPC